MLTKKLNETKGELMQVGENTPERFVGDERHLWVGPLARRLSRVLYCFPFCCGNKFPSACL